MFAVKPADSAVWDALEPFPNLNNIATKLAEFWPQHRSYIEMRFRNDTPEQLGHSETLAVLATKLIGDNLEQYLSDYKFMCDEFLEDELYFRRNGNYRLSTFKEAYDAYYNDDAYMSRYVRGILISQMIWDPHAKAFEHFHQVFLKGLPDNAKYLEVGPGHGLFLYFASQAPNVADITAWDVSKSSIAATTKAINALGVDKPVNLTEQDVLKAPPQENSFDGAVISEVLEHLEDPATALRTLHTCLKPGGRVFINVPINSPAPDHIYLWRSTEEFVDFVKAQGFKIHDAQFLPVTGATLERAKKQDLSISCVIIGEK